MKKIIYLLAFFLALGSGSCGVREVKLEGQYEDVGGGITFVLDAEASEKEGGDILKKITEEGEELLYSFEKGQVDEIARIFRELRENPEDAFIGASSVKTSYQEIIAILEGESSGD